MNYNHFPIILFFLISNYFIFCKFKTENDSIPPSLLESVENARTNLKEFQELYKLTRGEILKFSDLIKNIPNHDSYT
ncbi:putative integral membrane protein [Theileria parva strain Muguga]|nr:putative integral membrane protein [Theileria parva strain Muguga]KAF5153599.1 putative integral membrane protein [Theileria parva strain Muguga]